MKVFVNRGVILHDYRRYEDDTVYDVKPSLAQFFIANGWAEPAPQNAEAAEPFNTKNATEEDAEAWLAGKEERLARAQAKTAAASAPVDLDIQDLESEQGVDF